MLPTNNIVQGICIDTPGAKRLEQGVMLRAHPTLTDWYQLEISVVDATAQIPLNCPSDRKMLQRMCDYSLRDLIAEDIGEVKLPIKYFSCQEAAPAITAYLEISPDFKITDCHFARTQFQASQTVSYRQFEDYFHKGDASVVQWVRVLSRLDTPFTGDGNRDYVGDWVARLTSSLINHHAGLIMHKSDVPALFFDYGDIDSLLPHFRVMTADMFRDLPMEDRQYYAVKTTEKDDDRLYARITGPGRNYFDLINQRQLLATLQGEAPVYTAEELEPMSYSGNERLLFSKFPIMMREWLRGQYGVLADHHDARADQIAYGLVSDEFDYAAYAAANKNAGILRSDIVMSALFEQAATGKPLHGMLVGRLFDDIKGDFQNTDKLLSRVTQNHPDIADMRIDTRQGRNRFTAEITLLDAKGGIMGVISRADESFLRAYHNAAQATLESLLLDGLPAIEPAARTLLLTDDMVYRAPNSDEQFVTQGAAPCI